MSVVHLVLICADYFTIAHGVLLRFAACRCVNMLRIWGFGQLCYLKGASINLSYDSFVVFQFVSLSFR